MGLDYFGYEYHLKGYKIYYRDNIEAKTKLQAIKNAKRIESKFHGVPSTKIILDNMINLSKGEKLF